MKTCVFPPACAIHSPRPGAHFNSAVLFPVGSAHSQLLPSVPQQPECFPTDGQNCQTKAAEKRCNRAVETLQATINHPGKDREPEHKEQHHDARARRRLLVVQSRVDERAPAAAIPGCWRPRSARRSVAWRRCASPRQSAPRATISAPRIRVMRSARRSILSRSSLVRSTMGCVSWVMVCCRELPFPGPVSIPASSPILVFFSASYRHLDHVKQTRDAAEDHAGRLNPFLVQAWPATSPRPSPSAQPHGNTKATCISFSASISPPMPAESQHAAWRLTRRAA